MFTTLKFLAFLIICNLYCSSGKDNSHDIRDKASAQQSAAGTVDARVALERPCRTLFIRNIQVSYTTIILPTVYSVKIHRQVSMLKESYTILTLPPSPPMRRSII